MEAFDVAHNSGGNCMNVSLFLPYRHYVIARPTNGLNNQMQDIAVASERILIIDGFAVEHAGDVKIPLSDVLNIPHFLCEVLPLMKVKPAAGVARNTTLLSTSPSDIKLSINANSTNNNSSSFPCIRMPILPVIMFLIS
jgi:hypothetical protein